MSELLIEKEDTFFRKYKKALVDFAIIILLLTIGSLRG